MAKLHKIKLVKQQSFNFSHNLLKRCLVPRQDYVEKWQGQFSSFSFQAHAHSKSKTAAWLAQLGERRSAEPEVTGSNPGWTNTQGL